MKASGPSTGEAVRFVQEVVVSERWGRDGAGGKQADGRETWDIIPPGCGG